MEINFTGSETPSDIVRAAIEWFLQKPNSIGVTIFYEHSIPKMKYEVQAGNVECVCVYRLDKMLESFYIDAARILAENVRVGFVSKGERAILLPYVAFSGMTTMLTHLVVLQAEIFLQTVEDTRMITAGMFLHSLVSRNNPQASLSRPASKVIQGWIDDLVAALVKKKRDYLVGFMNTQRLLHIPTSVGRPPGSTKSAEKKAQDKAEFESKIEQAVRALFHTLSRKPFKYEVAEALGIGGRSSKGSDSRINSFNNKLTRLGIDYPAIIERLNLHE